MTWTRFPGRSVHQSLALGALLAGALPLAADAVAAGELPPPVITPGRIEVGISFGGASVRLEGDAPGATGVIVTILGDDEAQEFNRKQRFGPIWISSGRLRYFGVPALRLVFASDALDSLLPPAALEHHVLSRAALLARTHVEPEPDDPVLFRQEYVKWKSEFGLYDVRERAVSIEPAGGRGSPRYGLDFDWPKSAPTGDYRITVYAVRDGAIHGVWRSQLSVVKVGLPDRISSLSQSHPAWYGLCCILSAAAAGFGMDRLVALLGGKRAAH
jgi:hypothetical protein